MTLPELPPLEEGQPHVFGADSDRKVSIWMDLTNQQVCTHEVCLPPGYTEEILAMSLDEVKNPVRKYPFVLDPFQKVDSCISII